jgi:PPOX class probable F420-dependent enzyme
MPPRARPATIGMSDQEGQMTVIEQTAPRPAVRIPGKYLALATYRRDGSPVSTPLWFVEDEGRLFAITGADSYKVKRLRRNPACMVGPCSARGVPRGDAIPAVVEFLPELEHARVDELMAAKYRVDKVLILPLYRLVMRLRGKDTSDARSGAYLAITPV